MPKIAFYEIVKRTDSEALALAVNNFIHAGYQPLGDVWITTIWQDEHDPQKPAIWVQNPVNIYHQVVVEYAPEIETVDRNTLESVFPSKPKGGTE